jgi:hypothetical protein
MPSAEFSGMEAQEVNRIEDDAPALDGGAEKV